MSLYFITIAGVLAVILILSFQLTIKGVKLDFKKVIRGLLALEVVGTICYLAIIQIIAIETFTTLATIVVMFYFKKDED